MIKKNWPEIKWKIKKDQNLKETKLLKLVSNKARLQLGWKQVLSLNQTIEFVSKWYKEYLHKKKNKEQITINQINIFKDLLSKKIND